MHRPRETIFYPVRLRGASANRLVPIGYSAGQLETLREIARRAAARGDGNRLVKRAAVLHTDLALSAGRGGQPVPRTPSESLQRTTVFVEDGRQVALISAVDHWAVARRVLDAVRSRPDRDDPDPQRDQDVRLWYRATGALLIGNHLVDLPHFADAERMFPEDADILFLAGTVRDMASAPGVYQTLAQARGPRGSVMNLESQDKEMRNAESLLKRALAASPGHAEARLRLGRILARLDRLDAAARELRAAIQATSDPLLLYYGYQFLGSALDAQRDTAGARAAYERAAALAPDAQSPRLALSQLLARAGDRRGAMDVVRPSLASTTTEQADPFWAYYISPGRRASELMTQMYERLVPELQR
jgi:tetratricopeptide (TPR) repeat protein